MLYAADLYATCYRKFAEFVRAYDGDSPTFNIDNGDYNWDMKLSIRLFGVDTPEINPWWKHYEGREEERELEKQAAQEARDRVIAYCNAATNKIVVNTIKRPGKKLRDKYGRMLAKVFVPIDGVVLDLSERLLLEKHARPYSGGPKTPWVILRPLGKDDPSPADVAAQVKAEQSDG